MNPLFTLERKEFQLSDSRRLRKKAQDTQDAVLRFLKFSVSVALTLRLKFLRFLRFSVCYAIYNMNFCFDFFFSFNRSDKGFEIFLSNGDSGYSGKDHLWKSKFYIPFQPQKWAWNKSNNSVTSSCASCGFLRSRLESQSWNSFNPFPKGRP